MRVVFMGTAPLACPALERLAESDEDTVVAVVTQPDRPKGRHRRPARSVVKALALELGLPVLTPLNVNAPDSAAALSALEPDLIVVVAYGQILGRRTLDLPSKGCVNVHASLLPAYRGAAPIQWAIAGGEQVTGVTVMFMDEGLDTGDIILQKEIPIGEDDTAGSLHDRLAEAGAGLLFEAAAQIREGRATRIPQDHESASVAPKLKKEDGKISWEASADEIRNRVRGFHPWPCCYCTVGGAGEGPDRLLRVHRVRVEAGSAPPGAVVEAGDDGPLVAAGEGAVRLLCVQPEGGRAMGGADYLRGHVLRAGEVLR